ncbi:flippase [Halorientalis litorea]|uniref:flippase n=1 Tax=Halorientalis litorea TaxID=2931977 RepID=UPI001FF5F049|nr:flippase [Halorientalis litorea]
MASRESLRTLVKGAGFSLFGSVFSKVSHFAFYWVIARVAGADGFGVFSVALAVLGFSQIVSLLGLRGGVNRYVAYYRGQDDEARARGTVRIAVVAVLVSSLLVAVVVAAGHEYLADLLLDPGTPSRVLYLIAFVVPLEALSSVFMATLRGLKRIDFQVAAQNILQGILKITGFLAFYLAGFDTLVSLVFGYATAMVGTLLVGLYFVEGREFPVLRGGARYEPRELLVFSIPLLFTGALNLVVDWTDVLMLGYFGVNADVGIYNIALQVAMVMQIGFTAFGAITGPVLSELVGKDELGELESVLKISNKWVLVLTVPMVAFVFPFASDVVRLFGTEFRQGASVVVLIGIAMLVKTTFSMSGTVIKSMGHSNIILANHAVAGVLNFLMNLVLIPQLGIVGAAIATSVAIGLDGILPGVELYLWKRISPLRPDFVEPVAAAAVSTVAIFVGLGWATDIHYLMILPVGTVYLFVYGFVLMSIGGLKEEDVYILEAMRDRTGFESPRIERFVRRFV